jgi:hypothetical protein
MKQAASIDISALKMEATSSSETYVEFYRTARLYIPLELFINIIFSH